MNINSIGLPPVGLFNNDKSVHTISGKDGRESFSQVFDKYLNNVNTQLKESEKLTTQLATGEVKNLHDVTIAAQKASIALQLTVQVRDKALEAYQEMMRMQI